jgi:RNA polymerase sigma factor (sigma-70 family)
VPFNSENYERLVWKIISKRIEEIWDPEQVFIECLLAVWRSEEKYDESRSSYSTYIYRVINTKINDEIYKQYKDKTPRDQYIIDEEVADGIDIECEVILRVTIEDFVAYLRESSLTGEKKAMIFGYWVEGYSQKEISEKIGESYESVRQAMSRSIVPNFKEFWHR